MQSQYRCFDALRLHAPTMGHEGFNFLEDGLAKAIVINIGMKVFTGAHPAAARAKVVVEPTSPPGQPARWPDGQP